MSEYTVEWSEGSSEISVSAPNRQDALKMHAFIASDKKEEMWWGFLDASEIARIAEKEGVTGLEKPEDAFIHDD